MKIPPPSFQQKKEKIHPRLWVALLIARLLPKFVGSRLRARLLSWAGFRIGAGTVFWGIPTIVGDGDLSRRLVIGRDCWMNAGCYLDLGAPVEIGDRVAFGHQVLLITSTHEIGDAARRAGRSVACPIRIEDGAWLGSRCTILPSVTVHQGAVVAAGAVVTKDVPPNTIVAGVPAKVIRELEPGDGPPLELAFPEAREMRLPAL